MTTYISPECLLRQLGIESPEQIDLEAIAQFCGATIVYEPLRGCEARIIGSGNRAVITVNNQSGLCRRRFSGGHELGHWMRDRGKLAFSCTEPMLSGEWWKDNPEVRANEYAADLLLPEMFFRSDARDKEITFETVAELSSRYCCSTTAVAIRLVQLGSFPCMVVCSRRGQRWKWFKRSDDIPREIWPADEPGEDTLAYELLRGTRERQGLADVPASAWLRDDAVEERFVVREDSIRLTDDLVLSLIWWLDESMLMVDEG